MITETAVEEQRFGLAGPRLGGACSTSRSFWGSALPRSGYLFHCIGEEFPTANFLWASVCAFFSRLGGGDATMRSPWMARD